MRRRIAAAVVLLAGSSVLLTGCDGQLGDAIQSALPSGEITGLPTGLPTQRPTQTGGGEVATETPSAPQQSPEAPATVTATATATQSATVSPTGEPADETGPTSQVPTWAWVALALALLLLGALMIASARRRRGLDVQALTAQADGQITWLRENVDDALLRWRASQLQRPVDDRDGDSESAHRWALVDQRVTAATNDLLTLESGSKDAGIRQAAGMLRQALQGYRGSVDTLAQSLAVGDQARIDQAQQGVSADVSLLEQARQRLRQAARL